MRFESAFEVVSNSPPGEDRAAVLTLSHGLFAVVADGAGGTGTGAAIADFVVKTVTEFANRRGIVAGAGWKFHLGSLDRKRRSTGGEAAVVMALLTADRVTGASVGDCGAWLIGPGGTHRDLTENQKRKPLFGSGGAEVVAFDCPLPTGGTILLASDGVFNYAKPNAIAHEALDADLNAAVNRIVAFPRLASGALPDDAAAVLLRARAD